MVKEEMEKSDYKETVDFIKDNMKLVGEKDGPRYQVNQEHYNEFLGNHGITKETIKQIADTTANYNNGTVAVLKDMLLEDPKVSRVTINTRTNSGVISTRMSRQLETRTPVSGEPFTKFGVVSIKMNIKSRMDRGLLDECSREIEEASK